MSNGDYALYRFGYFSDMAGREYKIELTRRGWDFPFAAIELPIEQDSVTLEFDTNEPFEPVCPSQLTVTFLSHNVADFRPIFTADDELFRLSLYNVTGGAEELLWAGYVMPDEYQEAYKETPVRVDLTAIDGLGILEQKKLSSYLGYSTAIEIITECLFNLQDSQSSNPDTEVFSGTILEKLESRPGHVSFSEPLLSNIYHNRDNYTNKMPDEPEAEDFDCLTIIKEALRPYGAVLQQWTGGDFIIFEPQARAQTGDWFQYANGQYTGYKVQADSSYTLEFDGAPYDIETEHFPVLRDQKLNISKAIKAVNIDFEATKTRARGLIKDAGFKHYANTAQTLKYWSINENSQEGLTFEVRKNPHLREQRVISDGYLANDTDKAQIYVMGYESLQAQGNVFVFTRTDIGFANSILKNSTNDYIKSEPVPAPEESYEFSIKWQFPAPNIYQRNFSIKEFAPLQIELILEGDSGTDYWLKFDDQNEKYVFQTSNNQLELKTEDTKEQERTIKFETPEAGQIRLSIFGYGEHIGESNIYSAIGYRSGELAVWDIELRVAETASLKFNKTRKVNKEITYSTKDKSAKVIHWDNGVTPGSTGDVTQDEGGVTNTKDWSRKGVDEGGYSLLQNLANLYLDTFSRPLRLLSGTFNMVSIREFLINNFKLQEGSDVFTFYPVGGKLDLCRGFANLELKQVGEPSTNYFDPSLNPPEYDIPILDPEAGGGPVRDESPGLPTLTTGQPTPGFQTNHISSEATRVRTNQIEMSPEPADPAPGYSVEWLDDGSYEAPGVKWQKIISPEGQKIISKLGG